MPPTKQLRISDYYGWESWEMLVCFMMRELWLALIQNLVSKFAFRIIDSLLDQQIGSWKLDEKWWIEL